MATNARSRLGRNLERLSGAGIIPRRKVGGCRFGFPTNPLHDATEVLLDVDKLEPGDVDGSFHDHDDIGIVRELFTP